MSQSLILPSQPTHPTRPRRVFAPVVMSIDDYWLTVVRLPKEGS